MRIAVTAAEPTMTGNVDPRFGRCPYFLLVDPMNLSFEAVENPNLSLGQGAGIQTARLMAERQVAAVLTGHCGPNAHQALTAAGIAVILGCDGAVRDAIEQFKSGNLQPSPQPDVAGHAGQAAAPAGAATDQSAFQPGPGGGRGMGRGRGQGSGGGSGRGRGMGQGRGRRQGGQAN